MCICGVKKFTRNRHSGAQSAALSFFHALLDAVLAQFAINYARKLSLAWNTCPTDRTIFSSQLAATQLGDENNENQCLGVRGRGGRTLPEAKCTNFAPVANWQRAEISVCFLPSSPDACSCSRTDGRPNQRTKVGAAERSVRIRTHSLGTYFAQARNARTDTPPGCILLKAKQGGQMEMHSCVSHTD